MTQLMTEADIHDFGIEVVFGVLRKEKHEIVSVNTDVGRDPQIVCEYEGQLEFVIVRTAVFPGKGSLDAHTKASCMAEAERSGALCYFASVGIANSAAKTETEMAVPLKGAGFHVAFDGIELLHNGLQ
jgi:hypothetical protein